MTSKHHRYHLNVLVTILKWLNLSFRLIIGCVLMSPEAKSQKEMVTTPSLYMSDVELKRNYHRRQQKLCTTQRLPALFAWLLLLITSFTYWICIFPEIL